MGCYESKLKINNNVPIWVEEWVNMKKKNSIYEPLKIFD